MATVPSGNYRVRSWLESSESGNDWRWRALSAGRVPTRTADDTARGMSERCEADRREVSKANGDQREP
ncbi:hypothetical protein A6E15_05025 [Natrinema saccharevitans]|uniref:Uncharacterized protein n=1 Tax=Natrinema saccharevitans TaxID=301967 RepID=A0A1S8AVI8_9EURY|nr:hypothetical protein A6E15_05025 [Natrinema saccharevitans]